MIFRIPAVRHRIAGKRIIDYVLAALDRVATIQHVTEVGREYDDLMENIRDVVPESMSFIEATLEQTELNTARGVLDPAIGENVLIVEGSRPLVTEGTLRELISFHVDNGLHASWPCESNGLFAFSTLWLSKKLKAHQGGALWAQMKELCAGAVEEGVGACLAAGDSSELLKVETRLGLARATSLMRRRISDSLLRAGVELIDLENIYVDAAVTIDVNTIICPSVTIQGSTRIGADCVPGPNAIVRNSLIEWDCTIGSSVVIEGSCIFR